MEAVRAFMTITSKIATLVSCVSIMQNQTALCASWKWKFSLWCCFHKKKKAAGDSWNNWALKLFCIILYFFSSLLSGPLLSKTFKFPLASSNISGSIRVYSLNTAPCMRFAICCIESESISWRIWIWGLGFILTVDSACCNSTAAISVTAHLLSSPSRLSLEFSEVFLQPWCKALRQQTCVFELY